MDQVHEATSVLRVRSPEMFLVVRHRGSAGALDHTWVRQATGQSLEEYLTGLPVFAPGPEALLPKWALTAYRRIQSELLAAGNNHDETGVGVVGNDPHAL